MSEIHLEAACQLFETKLLYNIKIV